jgi:hypothetical protein
MKTSAGVRQLGNPFLATVLSVERASRLDLLFHRQGLPVQQLLPQLEPQVLARHHHDLLARRPPQGLELVERRRPSGDLVRLPSRSRAG